MAPTPKLSPAAMLASAREIYRSYSSIHTDGQQPIGVAMNQNTCRGQLIFSERPILLPHECFISAEEIEIEASPLPEQESC
ncbi:MAG: hypothetical protein HC934_05170 [Acaryochloridaceae cyanobacterium SU_2_1]|nr:hypothetical protein [Acaryochloridaceae cyanobacterium SU_2_1]